MNVANFRLSQIGGHTPKMKRGNKGGGGGGSRKPSGRQARVIESNWRLDPLQEEERKNLFGRLPRTSCHDYESKLSNEFPTSLKRRYLNARSQSSIYLKMLGGDQAITMSLGSSSTIVKQIEVEYIKVDKPPQTRPSPTKKVLPGNSESRRIRDIVDLIEESDSDGGSVDFGGGDNNSFDIVEQNMDGREGTDANSKNADNTALDGIFGSICQDDAEISMNPLQIANLFDEECHKSCAVVAPPGMELDDSDGISESSISISSSLSEMSINEDLCAFFEKDNTSDLKVTQPNQASQTLVPPIKSPSDHDHNGLVDDFGGLDNHEIDFDAHLESSERATDAGRCLDLAVIDGGNQQSNANMDTLSPKQAVGDEGTRALAGEKENINSQLPSSQDSNAFEEREAFEERQSLHSHEKEKDQSTNASIANASSHQLNDENAPCAKNDARDVSAQEKESPMVTSFRLPTPPPSSDDDSDDVDDEDSVKQNELMDLNSGHTSLDQSPRLPSPNDPGEVCEGFAGLVVEKEEVVSNAATFFQLPTQDSSSSEEDDEEEEEDGEEDDDEPNEQPPGRNCSANLDNSFLETTATETKETEEEVNNDVNKTAMSQDYPDGCLNLSTQNQHFVCNEEESLKEQSSSLLDQHVSDTRHVHFNTASFKQKQPAAEGLTDTPIKAPFTNKHAQKLGANSRMSLDSLTDTPLKPRHSLSQPRKSLDSLTDTPMQCQRNVGKQQRKRLRAAQRHNANDEKPEEAGSLEKIQKKDTLRKRIEDKYRCKFLDVEAANDDSDESDEEAALKQIEDEEMSHDSFINDTSQLGYSQDELDHVNADAEVELCDGGDDVHRQFNHQVDIDNQWKTPVLNRRMREEEPTSESQEYTQSSDQKGLGRMNFIRSVLEHHRAGGDADALEDEYHRLAENDQSPIQSTQPSNCNDGQASQSCTVVGPATSLDSSLHQQQNLTGGVSQRTTTVSSFAVAASATVNKPVTLTEEQRAMIEAKRLEALKRRQQRMQQHSATGSTSFNNPYAK